MPWFSAHAILYVRFKDGDQSSFPVWENVYLIDSPNPDVAVVMAENRAREDQGDSNQTFLWEGRPAEWVFVGIRKLISISHGNNGSVLTHGDELTYSEFSASSIDQVHALAKGLTVQLKYEE